MIHAISFDVNNQRTMKLVQRQHNGTTLIMVEDASGNCESINDKENVIHVNKKISYAYGGSVPRLENHLKSKNGLRDVPLLPALAAALPRNKVGLIFPGKGGGFMTEGELNQKWKEYCRAVELNKLTILDKKHTQESFPITPHCLRHSFATICYEAGLDARQAAKILGDTPQEVDGIYTHLREQHSTSVPEKLAVCLG